MADKKFNIKDQLAGIAALIAAIVAIGGGFVKYGEVMTKLDVLTKASKTVDKVSIEMVAVLQEKVKKLENKKDVVVDYSSEIAVIEEKVEKLENKEDVVVDLSDIESNISEIGEGLNQTKLKSLVNSKEIELLKVQIEEIKVSTSNPLAN